MARSIKDSISSAFSDDPNGDFFRRMSMGNDGDDDDTGGGSDKIPMSPTTAKSDATRVAKQYPSSDELMKIARGRYRNDLLRLFGSVKKDPDRHETLEMEAGKKLRISGDDVSVLNPDGTVASQGSFESFEKMVMQGDSDGTGQQQGGSVSMTGGGNRAAGGGGNNQGGGGGRMMGGDSSNKNALSPDDMPRGVDRSESARSNSMEFIHSAAKRAVQEGRGDEELRKQQARKAQLLKDLPRLKPGTDAHYIAEQGVKDADMTIEVINAQNKEILQSQRKR